MELLEVLRICDGLLQRSTSHRFESGDSVVYEVHARDEIDKELAAASIKHSKIGNNEISIRLSDFQGLFYSDDDFLQHCKATTFNSNIGILFHVDDKYLFYDAQTAQTSVGGEVHPSDKFVQNTNYYWKFYETIRSLEISVYYSAANREFVLISPTKGKFLLGHTQVPPRFSSEIDLKAKYDALQNMNQSKEFRLFLKEQIIDSLSLCEHDRVLQTLIEKIEAIIEAGNRNYEVYLNKFNFEDLKNNFRRERDEYFSRIRDIINQILSKIASIPISISASALAIYNLNNEVAYAIIVVIAFVVYSLFNAFLLRLLHVDILEIRREFGKDLETIKESSNIPSDVLEEEASKVYRKIITLETTINVLQVLLAILALAVLAVFLQNTILSIGICAIILLIALALHISVSWLNLFNKTSSPSPI